MPHKTPDSWWKCIRKPTVITQRRETRKGEFYNLIKYRCRHLCAIQYVFPNRLYHSPRCNTFSCWPLWRHRSIFQMNNKYFSFLNFHFRQRSASQQTKGHHLELSVVLLGVNCVVWAIKLTSSVCLNGLIKWLAKGYNKTKNGIFKENSVKIQQN